MATLDSLEAEYDREQRAIRRRLTGLLAEAFPALALSRVDASAPGWRTAAVAIARDGHAEMSDLGTEFYSQYRKASGVKSKFEFVLPSFAPAPLARSLTMVGPWQAKHLMSTGTLMPDVAKTVFAKTTGVAVRTANAGARDLVADTSMFDSRAWGWARKTGPNPCGFCVVMALNRYDSFETAIGTGGRGMDVELTKGKSGGQAQGVHKRRSQEIGEAYHDSCQCTAFPAFDMSAWPAGYLEQMDWYQVLYQSTDRFEGHDALAKTASQIDGFLRTTKPGDFVA